MNKRLLLSLAVGLTSMASFAYEVGDYIYTTDAKFKVTGANLIANGSFANNYASWTQLDGSTAVSTEFWSIESGYGPDGENVLQSLSNTDGDDGAYVFQTVPFEAGKTYVISCKVYTPSAVTTSVSEGGANYLDVFANSDYSSSKDADRFQQVATTLGISANEWTDVAFAFTDTVTGGQAGGIAIAFGRFDVGSQITGFEVHEVNEVYDTRVLEARLNLVNSLLAEEALPNGRDGEVANIVAALQACLDGQGENYGINVDDVSAMEEMISLLDNAQAEFLDANSYDLIANSITSNTALWSTKLQKANGTYGDWYCEGSGRWFHDPSDDEDVRDYIPSAYSLSEGVLRVQKALPAGKYLFMIDAYGVIYQSGKKDSDGNYTVVDYDSNFLNRLYVCSDTTAVDTLSNLDYKTYYVIGEAPEGATAEELNVVAGIWHSASSSGGTAYYKSPVLRYISTTAEADIAKFIQDNEKEVQLNAARVMIDSAIVVVAKTEYPWGKTALQAGIDECEADYAALELTESTVELANASGDGTTVTVADSLSEVMSNMRGYIRAYYTLNAAYTDLVASVDNAQSLLDDEANSNASTDTRNALQKAVDNANACITTFAAQTDSLAGDLAKSDELIAAIDAAIAEFQATTATLANPGSNLLTNASFESGDATGWDTSGSQTDNGRWKYSSSYTTFDVNSVITMWRGQTAHSQNKVVQNVTVSHAGTYVFTTQMYGYNETGSYDGDQTTNSHCYIFAKVVDSADSIAAISMHTNDVYNDTIGYGNTTPEYFAIIYNKTDEADTEIQVGFDGLQNESDAHSSYGGHNTYVMGSNTLKYMGNFTSFQSDLESTLKSEMEEAQAALAANPSQSTDSTIYINGEAALRNAVLAAQSAIDGTTLAYPLSSSLTAPFLQTWVEYIAAESETGTAENRYVCNSDATLEKAGVEYKALLTLRRAANNFAGLVTGIQGVSADDIATAKVAAQGVYNLSGQKVGNSVQGLSKGIYIVNGKKVIVK